MANARGALLCWALCCSACFEQQPEVQQPPTPPDMTALLAVYDSPTGTFDQERALEAIDAARRLAEQIETLGIDALLLDLVQDAVVALSETDDSAAGEGYLEATRICAGWQPQPEPAEGHGQIELTVGFHEQRVDAVAWGQTTACEYLADGRRVLLYGSTGAVAGDVRLSFAESVAFDSIARQPVLLDLDATAEVDGNPQSADFDFRIDPLTGTLEIRVPVQDGEIVVTMENQAPSLVRAANGGFAL